jgi:hypothetical protein
MPFPNGYRGPGTRPLGPDISTSATSTASTALPLRQNTSAGSSPTNPRPNQRTSSGSTRAFFESKADSTTTTDRRLISTKRRSMAAFGSSLGQASSRADDSACCEKDLRSTPGTRRKTDNAEPPSQPSRNWQASTHSSPSRRLQTASLPHETCCRGLKAPIGRPRKIATTLRRRTGNTIDRGGGRTTSNSRWLGPPEQRLPRPQGKTDRLHYDSKTPAT